MKTPSIVLRLFVLLCSLPLFGQADQSTNFTPPTAIYHGSDIESVSLPMRNLHISIPLVHLKGRGLDLDVNATFNTQSWSTSDTTDTNAQLRQILTSPGATSAWNVGVARMGYITGTTSKCIVVAGDGSGNCLQYALYANFLTSEGSNIQLGDDSGLHTTGAPPTAFWSNDGSYIRIPNLSVRKLLYKDGVSLNHSSSSVSLEDTNGNIISCITSNGTQSCTDTIGRVVNFVYSSSGVVTSINYQDSSGTIQSVNFTWQTFLLDAPWSNGPCVGGSPQTCYDSEESQVPLITRITLPNGLFYSFQYVMTGTTTNSTTGQISKMTLPTGGYISYTYGCSSGSTCPSPSYALPPAQEPWAPVLTRTVSSDGTAASEKTLSYSSGQVDSTYGQPFTITDPLGNTQTSYFKWNLQCPPAPTRIDTKDSSGTMLRQVFNTIGTDQSRYTDPSPDPTLGTACNNPRVTASKTILSDTNQQSQVTYTFGTFGNISDKYDYDWGNGSVGSLLRHTTYQYLHDASSAYSDPGAHILDRVTNQSIYDSSGTLLEKTLTTYDGSTPSATSNVVQHDYANFTASTTTRGNPTQTQHWLSGGVSPTITNTYNDVGNLLQTTDPNGNTTSFDYSDNYLNVAPSQPTSAFVTKTTKPSTSGTNHISKTQYYFATGLAAATCGENFSAASCAFGANGTNPDYSTFTYDWQGRPLSVNHGDGGQTSLAYNEATLPLNITSTTKIDTSTNLVTSDVYDGLGRMSQTQLNSDPSGIDYVDTSYDALGRKASVSNPHRSTASTSDGITTFQYDALGRTTMVLKQDGSASRWSYMGNCTTVTDEAGKPRKSCTDALGRLIEVDEPNASSTGTSATATVTISGSLAISGSVVDSGLVSITTGGFTATACYGSSTNSACTGSAANNTAAQVASALAAAFNVTGSPASAIISGATLNLTWNTPGPFFPSVSALATTHDQPGTFPNPSFVSTATMFDHGTGPSLTVSPYVTLYQYDALGNLVCVEQHGGVTGTGCSASPSSDSTSPWRVRRFTYDSLSRLLTASNPESGLITYFYDANGNMLQKVMPSPNQTGSAQHTISYCYDPLNRLTGKAYSWQNCQNGQVPSGTAGVSYSYDQGTNGIGRLTGVTDQAGSASYTYDIMGQLVTEQRTTNSVTKAMGYTYDLHGSLTTATYPSGAVINYASDAAGRAKSAIDTSNNINYITGATYGPHNAITGFVSGAQPGGFSGIISTNVYDVRLQPCRMTASTAGAIPTNCDNSSGNVLDLRYYYDLWIGDNGNVTKIANFRDQTRNQFFTYDGLNRLTSAQNGGSNCSVTVIGGQTKFWGNSYTYDAWGNLMQKQATKCQAENLNTAVNQLNRLQSFNYDAAGNLTGDNLGTTYVYDSENRISSSSGFTYTYDADGNRAQKVNGNTTPATGTLYWYMSLGVVAESDLSGNLQSEYIFFNGERVARKDFPGGAISYYFSDHLKTATVITDSTGHIKSESDYYPWGGEIQLANGDSNHYKFTAKERDPESGLDYFGARYYSNGLGRFLTPDWAAKATAVPYADYADPQSLNLYTYVRNLPTVRFDPDGHVGGGTDATDPDLNKLKNAKIQSYTAITPVDPKVNDDGSFTYTNREVTNWSASDSQGNLLYVGRTTVETTVTVKQDGTFTTNQSLDVEAYKNTPKGLTGAPGITAHNLPVQSIDPKDAFAAIGKSYSYLFGKDGDMGFRGFQMVQNALIKHNQQMANDFANQMWKWANNKEELDKWLNGAHAVEAGKHLFRH